MNPTGLRFPLNPGPPAGSAAPRLLCRGAALLALLAGGCAVGPNYHRPAVSVPAAYKESAGWKAATPNDATARGAWWEIFGDPRLNELEAQVAVSNPTIQAAAANYQAAREIARADRADFFPAITADGSATRAEQRTTSSGGSGAANSYAASLGASWSPDFWGRVRRLTEADVAAAQSSAALLATSQLSLQTTLAQDYIALRSLDEKARLLATGVESYRRTYQIAQNKYHAGIVARNDVISSETQLDSTRAQELDTGIQRAQLEHAIAVLVGKTPAEFSLPVQPVVGLAAPAVPAQLPSDLLERRPDIAQAERAAAAANARVGVQTAAYFPDISLSAQGGFQGSSLSHLFSLPYRFWSLGAGASETLLDFGQRRAQVAEASAVYDASVASYRAAVLSAFQQVEDNLAAQRILAEESTVQTNAVAEAAEASKIAENEYRAGTVDYTTVVTAQEIELSNRETLLALLQNQLSSGAALIEALGGGWSAHDLPDRGAVMSRPGSAAKP
jgi:NodT family efflux transporter outer membrane factor (OMF) lipoprotein